MPIFKVHTPYQPADDQPVAIKTISTGIRHAERYVAHKCIVLLLALAPAVPAADWSLTFGLHDLMVTDENSHTFGADIGIAGKATTQWGALIDASLTAFFSHNKDELDPDYEPIWYKSDVHMHKELHSLASNINLDWLIQLDGKLNTVSAVEKQIKAFSGVGVHYETSTMKLGLQTLAGYYFLEIDDDVPLEKGYDISDLQNKTAAYSVMVDNNIILYSKLNAYARIQQYRDNDQWLENQYELMINYDVTQWIQNSTLTLSAEHTQYNLEPYQKTGLTPILPWNSDTLIRLYLSVAIF